VKTIVKGTTQHVCRFCRHLRDWHYVTKHVRPDGTSGGQRTTTGCSQCICRRYES
jgi:hypothetical protein